MSEKRYDKKFNPNQPVFVIFWSFHAEGPVEPCDVVGTLYSAIKGLLEGGKDLEDLVEKGDVVSTPYVKISHDGTKSEGRIHVQTKMSKWRTAELAAALETVDEVGPGYDAKIETERIKFTRGGKKRLSKLRAEEMIQDESLWTTGPSVRNEIGPKRAAANG